LIRVRTSDQQRDDARLWHGDQHSLSGDVVAVVRREVQARLEAIQIDKRIIAVAALT
jgi:hypothetical protein